MRNVKDNSKYNLSQQEIQDTDKNIESLTPSVKKIFNYCIATANIRKSNFVSQSLMAKKLGLSRETVNRGLKLLHKLGLITKIDRGWKENRTRIKKTCYYIINKLFFYQEIRNRYKHIFIALSYMVIFCNFESIFGVWSKDERQHYEMFITGIKSSSYSLFKNKEVGNLDYRVNRILRRRQGIREGLKQEGSNLTIEEGSRKMSEFISTLGGFNEEAKTYLSAYDEEVVKESIRCLGKRVPNGNQFTYFTKILNRVNQERQKKPDLGILNKITGTPQLQVPITSPHLIASPSPKPFYRKGEQEKKHVPSTAERMQKDKERRAIEEATIQANVETKITVLELAHRIANLKEQAETKPFMKEMLPETISGLINCGYRTTGEFNEDIALAYIEKQRVKFNLTLPKPEPTKDPSSNPTNLGNLINQVLPERPLQKGEILNNGAPLPERLEMLARAREKLGLPPKQEPSRPTTVMPVSPVAKGLLRQGYEGQALEDPAIQDKMLMIKEAFPSAQLIQVEGKEEENESESTTYNEIDYEEVYD